MRTNITHLLTRRMKMSHTHLRHCLPVYTLQAQIRIWNRLVCCLRIKYKKLKWIRTATRRTINAPADKDEDEPYPPSRLSSISQPPSPEFSTSSSEDEDGGGNVAGQQPQPSQWTLPPKPRRRVVHTFTGAPNRKSSEAAHVTRQSTPLSNLLLFFAEIITSLVVEMYHYYHQFLDNTDKEPSPQCEVTEAEMFCVFGCDIIDGTYSSRQTEGLLDKNGTALLSILWTSDGTCYVLSHTMLSTVHGQ